MCVCVCGGGSETLTEFGPRYVIFSEEAQNEKVQIKIGYNIIPFTIAAHYKSLMFFFLFYVIQSYCM